MLLVQVDSVLNSIVSDNITLSEVLSNNACAWLLLLCDLVRVALGITSDMVIIVVLAGAGDLNLSRSKLCVVE